MAIKRITTMTRSSSRRRIPVAAIIFGRLRIECFTADFQDETSSVKALHLDGVNEKREALVSSPPAVSMMDYMQ